MQAIDRQPDSWFNSRIDRSKQFDFIFVVSTIPTDSSGGSYVIYVGGYTSQILIGSFTR
jgi:hypothetical protein